MAGMKLRKRKSDKTVSLDEGVDTGEEVMVREIAKPRPVPCDERAVERRRP